MTHWKNSFGVASVYLKCWVTYFTSSDSSPNASVVSRVTRVDEEGGSRSTKGLLRHHERSSSPLKFPGPSMQQLSRPSLSTWLLWRWPLTINSILWTGSPSLVICIQFRLLTDEFYGGRLEMVPEMAHLVCTNLRAQRAIKFSFEVILQLTVSPFVNMRDFTRSQIFSRTRLSICWNKGTWKQSKLIGD